ncbi:hypothetical protein KMZ68_18070 [Bradyrhizobium sediminis]|uniref:Ribosomal RNA large subunit methyltransferase K/L-like methyltransferase domain-containing protein n=1 Tax=Bradyrhizobium sediminis TaxID=2840469 RepID=A0A975NMU1_9BRAD|nr:hypothetical protein [Bradyrhizobium sediminis]QWG16879.1 hypothetical protein KMZ68_18070 [Bradyrhizobium sediminis]
MTASDGDRLFNAVRIAISQTLEQFQISGTSQELSTTFASCFIKEYYHQNSYLFILRYGCGVTSLGYGELRDLLRYYALPRSRSEINVSFHSSRALEFELIAIWDTLVAPLNEFQTISSTIGDLYLTSNSPAKFAELYLQICESAQHQTDIKDLLGKAPKQICDLHGASLRGLIVLDAYYATCAVSISDDLKIDLPSIVGRSGYVHSAGPLLYIRNTGKFERSALLSRMSTYHAGLRLAAKDDGKLPLFLVANEHLDLYDSARAEGDSGRGVFQIRIPKDKFFIGGQPAPDFWDSLIADNELNKIVTPMPGLQDPHHEIEAFAAEGQPLAHQALFLFRDFGVDEQHNRSSEQYIMLYARVFRNSSPFFIFDETKPGWYAPVTAPHTMTSAMLNLCLAGRTKSRGTTVICDPFVGSGTSALEALRFPGKVRFVAGDLSKPAGIARADNFAFFSLPQFAHGETSPKIKHHLSSEVSSIPLSINGLAGLLRGLTGPAMEELVKRAIEGATSISVRRPKPKPPVAIEAGLEWSLTAMLMLLVQNAPEASKTQAGVRQLREYDFSPALLAFSEPEFLPLRVLTYLCWRAILRIGYALYKEKDKVAILTKALLFEFESFALRCQLLADIRSLRPDQDVKPLNERLLIQKGWYSPEIIVPLEAVQIQGTSFEFDDKLHIDALSLLKSLRKEVDILITDPPYAFNTDNYEENVELYKGLPTAIVQCLKDNGQAVICLPEQSHNGQNIPSYARKSWFVRAFLAAAARDKAQVVNLAETRPAYDPLFDPPHYWRSNRALTRSVLHFTLHRN